MTIINDGLSEDARSFYKVINQIKTMYKDTTISEEDRIKVVELLRVLKYKVQFDVLNQCIQNNDYITSVLAGIDTKLLHIDAEREEIKQQIEEMDLVPNTKRLVALRRTSNELDRIKSLIEKRQFNFVIQALNEGLVTTNELVSACNLVLKEGVQDYSKLFGTQLVVDGQINKRAIDLLFEIILDTSLKKDLRKYVEANQAYLNLLDKKQDNERFLKLVKLASNNQVALREYLRVRSVLSESSHNTYIKNREILATKRIVLDNLPTDGIAGIFNRKQRDSLSIEIMAAEHEIKEYETKMEEVKKLEGILLNVGLGDVIDSLSNTNYEQNLSVPERAAMYVKTACGRAAFDYHTAEVSVKKSNEELDQKISKAIMRSESELAALSTKAHRLIVEDRQDILKIMSLLEEKKEEGLSPLLAAFILKALSDSKNLDYQDIVDMCNLDVNVEQLYGQYLQATQDEVLEIQNQITNIQYEEEEITTGHQIRK